MGLLERWDRHNARVLAEQNEDMKGPDWATKSKSSRKAAKVAPIAPAGIGFAAAARSIGGPIGYAVFAIGMAVLLAAVWWSVRRIDRS